MCLIIWLGEKFVTRILPLCCMLWSLSCGSFLTVALRRRWDNEARDESRYTRRRNENKKVDSRDIHFAVRVTSYRETRDYLRSKGFHPEAADEFTKMIENPKATAGFPQLYIMDPDRNVIELNAEQLDED